MKAVLIILLKPILLLALLSLVLAGCGVSQPPAPASGVAMTLEVEPNPPGVGPSHLTVILADSAGKPIEGGSLKIEGSMSHDGMQPRLARAKAGSEGKYEAPFVWSMAGDWVLTVTAALPNGQEVIGQFDFTVAGEVAKREQDHAPALIPNQGAVVRIVSPQDGAMIEPGQEVKVEIETDNFGLGQNGNHWHVLVDGQSPRMIMGAMTETMLPDLEPGRHEISIRLSNGKHEELLEGAAVVVTVAGPERDSAMMSMEEGDEEPAHDHAEDSE
ncbi:MAG: FixH family protein [Anaerolineae bacterium]|nr:FixH family protein [Anaerolineae bacterium]